MARWGFLVSGHWILDIVMKKGRVGGCALFSWCALLMREAKREFRISMGLQDLVDGDDA